MPWQPELALGAVGDGVVVVLNDGVVSVDGVGPDQLEALVCEALCQIEDDVAQRRPETSPLDVNGPMVIVVDNGVGHRWRLLELLCPF